MEGPAPASAPFQQRGRVPHPVTCGPRTRNPTLGQCARPPLRQGSSPNPPPVLPAASFLRTSSCLLSLSPSSTPPAPSATACTSSSSSSYLSSSVRTCTAVRHVRHSNCDHVLEVEPVCAAACPVHKDAPDAYRPPPTGLLNGASLVPTTTTCRPLPPTLPSSSHSGLAVLAAALSALRRLRSSAWG